MNSVPVKGVNLSKEMGIDVLYDNYEYKQINSTNRMHPEYTMEVLINKNLKDGWKLYGNLGMSHNGGSGNSSEVYYSQGMIRKLPAKGGNRTRRNR